jgi:hypothetical protein
VQKQMISKNGIAKLPTITLLIALIATIMLSGISQVNAETDTNTTEMPLIIYTAATVAVTVIIIVSAVVLLITRKHKAMASLIPQA